MTPAQRYDFIVTQLMYAAMELQEHRNSDNHNRWLNGQDNLAVAEYHSEKLQEECPKINLYGTIDICNSL